MGEGDRCVAFRRRRLVRREWHTSRRPHSSDSTFPAYTVTQYIDWGWIVRRRLICRGCANLGSSRRSVRRPSRTYQLSATRSETVPSWLVRYPRHRCPWPRTHAARFHYLRRRRRRRPSPPLPVLHAVATTTTTTTTTTTINLPPPSLTLSHSVALLTPSTFARRSNSRHGSSTAGIKTCRWQASRGTQRYVSAGPLSGVASRYR